MVLVLLAMMAAHLISDAFLQSREEAKGKSEDKSVLFKHVRTNFLVTAGVLLLLNVTLVLTDDYTMLDGLLLLLAIPKSIMPALWNAAIHAVIDWNIWRLYKKSVAHRFPRALPSTFQFWTDPWFFHTIMIDQFLHYATIGAIAYLVAG